MSEWPAHSDPALALARSIAQLRSLTIVRTPGDRREFGDAGAAALAPHLGDLTYLSLLSFTNCSMHEQGLRALASALHALPQRAAPTYVLPPPCSTSAAAPGDHQAAAAAVAAAAQAPVGGVLPELRSLVLREDRPLDTTMCAEAFQVILEAAPNVVRLSCGPFGSPRIVSLAPVIAGLRRLQSLDISANMMADPGAIAFGHNLPRIASTLTSLDISGNAVTPAGMGALLPALQTLKELRTLSLDGNHVGNECAESLAQALSSMSQLHHLSMHSLGLGDSAIEIIAPALSCVTQVTYLGLSNNFIGCKGIEALASQGLPHLSSLAEIRLSGNWMLDDGACTLAKSACTALTALTRIALDHAFVSDLGAMELAVTARTLSCLQQLSLSGNLIGHEGGMSLTSVRSVKVDMTGNPWNLGEVWYRMLLVHARVFSCSLGYRSSTQLCTNRTYVLVPLGTFARCLGAGTIKA